MIAKLLFLPLLAAAASLAPVCDVSANSIQGARASIPQNAVSLTRSEFEKEQAMSPLQLMDRWTPLVEEASHRFGVSVAWIQAVMRMESGGRTLQDDKRPIISDAGAMGIMQIMPETYREMRRQYGLGADPYNPHDNVMAGTAYLRWLYGKYGYPKMFAAYNAGPGVLEAQFAGLRRLPDETRAYVIGITRILGTEPDSSPSTPSQPVKMLAALTRPDGSIITIDGAAVDSIRASLPDEYAPGVQTVLAMGNMHQGVREDMATVASLIGERGGKV